jgi:hypothetical protein
MILALMAEKMEKKDFLGGGRRGVYIGIEGRVFVLFVKGVEGVKEGG